MKIIHLADATEYIPMLAKWFDSDWPPSSAGMGPATDFETRVSDVARANRSCPSASLRSTTVIRSARSCLLERVCACGPAADRTVGSRA